MRHYNARTPPEPGAFFAFTAAPMIELTASELALVAGGDGFLSVHVDDGSLTGAFTVTENSVALAASGSANAAGEFEVDFNLSVSNEPED